MKISDFSLRHCLRITEIIIANNPGKCKGQDDNNYNIASPPLSFVRSGFVILDYGSLRYFGINGYGWSSASQAFTSVTSATAYYLGFGASGVHPSDGPDNRWDGFPIRCCLSAKMLRIKKTSFYKTVYVFKKRKLWSVWQYGTQSKKSPLKGDLAHNPKLIVDIFDLDRGAHGSCEIEGLDKATFKRGRTVAF